MKFEHAMTIICTCPHCHKVHEVEVDFEDYTNYMMGDANIQDAFPYLSANEREYLLSGLCEGCWDSLFAEEEEEEEEDEGEDFDDSVDETGFNPYSGCYDFDC